MSGLSELSNYLQQTFGVRRSAPNLACLDCEDYLRRTELFDVLPAERLRQLAIFLERECSTGNPKDEWAVLHRVYDFGTSMNPTDDALWWSRGIAATHLAEIEGKTSLAEELFAEGEAACRKALELAPKNPSILYSLGINAYMNPGKPVQQAKQWFAAALEIDPNHVMAQLYLGHCCHDEGQWHAALDAYRRVDQEQLARDLPRWRTVKLREQMAFCCMKCGRRAEAVKQFQEVLTAYETIAPDQALDLAFPDELVSVATGELRADLYDRTKTCIEKIGHGKLYAQQFERAAGQQPPTS